jgi:predicted SnoaL-like aldol condensation-catalyzing enzyme
MSPKLTAALALAALLAAAAANAARPPSKAPLTNDPKGMAAFGLLDMAFNQHRVADAFAKYVGPTYSQSGGPDAKAASIKALSAIVERNPDFRYDIKRVLVDRDVAAVYAMAYTSRTAAPWKVVDFFRFEKGKIVEHWDVVQTQARPAATAAAPPPGRPALIGPPTPAN